MLRNYTYYCCIKNILNVLVRKYDILYNHQRLQFDFKTNYDCVNDTFLKSEYFDNKWSTISPCALDITKAFEKTNHYALFIELIKRDVPTSLILIRLNWHDNSWSSVSC